MLAIYSITITSEHMLEQGNLPDIDWPISFVQILLPETFLIYCPEQFWLPWFEQICTGIKCRWLQKMAFGQFSINLMCICPILPHPESFIIIKSNNIFILVMCEENDQIRNTFAMCLDLSSRVFIETAPILAFLIKHRIP